MASPNDEFPPPNVRIKVLTDIDPTGALHELRQSREHKWNGRFLDMARLAATWSKDPSTKVGAVIVDGKRRVIGMGYNGFPRGVHDSTDAYADKAQKYLMVVHAEANAILNAVKSVENCTIYCTFAPCSACAALIIQSGIKRVIFGRNDEAEERWKDNMAVARKMLNQAGIDYGYE